MSVMIPKEAGPAVRFAIQVLVGTFVFSVILLAAFGLSELVSWMQARGAPEWMITGAHWVEWCVFWLDVFLFGLFLFSEVLKFVIGLWKEWRA